MPIFMCRWQNGDTAFVHGNDKADAIGRLDLELDYAEDWQLTRVPDFLLGIALKDDGEFEIDFMGEALQEALRKEYPILAVARNRIYEAGDALSAEEQKEILHEAVVKERARLEATSSKNPQKTASTYSQMMRKTYGIPSEADIIVTGAESGDVKLLAEVKLDSAYSKSAEAKLKNWMTQLSSPVGLIITPDKLSLYSDQYKPERADSIELVGVYGISHLLQFSPESGGNVSGSAEAVYFENHVQRWLESLPQTATSERVNNSDLWRALNIYVLPAIENGIVRAASPRYR